MTLFFLAIFVINGAISSYFARKTVSHLDPANVEVLKEVILLSRYLKSIESNLSSAAETGEIEFVKKTSQTERQFLSLIENLKAYDPGLSKEYDKVRAIFMEYIQAGKRLSQILLKEDFSNPEVAVNANMVKLLLPQLKKHMDSLEDAKYQEFLNLQQAMEEISREHVRTDVAITLMVIVFSIITAPIMVRSINKPLRELVRATKELGAGNLAARADVKTKDEIGVLAESFNSTAEQLNMAQQKLYETNEILKDANRQLKEADKHKTEFLASMSHELRTPLNAIINFSDQIIEDWEELKKDDEWNKDAKDMLERVLKSSRHLLSLINDLLDLAKIEAGMMKLELMDNDLGSIIADTMANVQPLAGAKGIFLERTIQPDLPPVACDERKIMQVILNLLSNAIKFTDSGGVHVKLFQKAGYKDGLVLEVRDSGIGIPADAVHYVFDRFRQVDGSDAKRYQGTGLGLNLVKEIVEMHGGAIEVESEVGKGSCFRVFLPYNGGRKEKPA
ncbi:MAG: HAMP domain-containing histidine kinase [Nitrospinae bacterium]|nr:HAMP domain-containing histidine kinase [Nitrospinota bacterium]